MIRSAMFQHLFGILGQASAAFPLLLVMIYVSREAGLEIAGHFAVFTAMSAVAYSASLWGMRNLMILDRYNNFHLRDFVGLRLAATLALACTIIMFAVGKNVPWALVFSVIFVRTTDAIIDVRLGHDQSSKPSFDAIFAYTVRQGLKFVAIFLALVTGNTFSDFEFTSKFVCGVSFLVLAIHLLQILKLANSQRSNFETNLYSRWFRIIREASWFAFAAFVCAVLTNGPRTNLGAFFEGEKLGAIGGTLALASLFGMTYNVTWLRAFPQLAGPSIPKLALKAFILENLAIVLILICISWLVLPYFVPLILGFDQSAFGSLPQYVLTASAVFFFGQIFCNLFKLTSRKWLEPLAYALGFSFLIAVGYLYPTEKGFVFSLLISGAAMVFFSLSFFWYEMKTTGRLGYEER